MDMQSNFSITTRLDMFTYSRNKVPTSRTDVYLLAGITTVFIHNIGFDTSWNFVLISEQMLSLERFVHYLNTFTRCFEDFIQLAN